MLVRMKFDGRSMKTKIITIGATKNHKKRHKKKKHFYKIFHLSSFFILPNQEGHGGKKGLIQLRQKRHGLEFFRVLERTQFLCKSLLIISSCYTSQLALNNIQIICKYK